MSQLVHPNLKRPFEGDSDDRASSSRRIKALEERNSDLAQKNADLLEKYTALKKRVVPVLGRPTTISDLEAYDCASIYFHRHQSTDPSAESMC